MRAIKELFMKEGRGKRICSILTALAMTLSLFAGVGAASFAEEDVPEVSTEAVAETVSEAAPKVEAETVPETVAETITGEESAQQLMDGESKTPIETVEVDIIIPLVNATDTTVKFSFDANVGYTVTAQKGKWRDGGGSPATSFVRSNDYYASFTVTPKDEYVLTSDTRVLVNGTEENVSLLGGETYPASQFELKCQPEVKDYISEVHLTGVPEVIIGAKATPYSYSSPDGTYQAIGTWFVYDRQARSYQQVDSNQTFTDGKTYKLEMDLIFMPGYVVSPKGCSVYANGIAQSSNYDRDSIYIDPIYFGTGKEIMKVAVDEASIPKAVAGKTFADKTINVKAPSGSNYTLAGYWTDEDGNRSGTFTKGKVYYFNLMIYAKDGYCLTKDLEISVGDELNWVTSESAFAEYQIRQSLAQIINEVTLKNLPKAKIGAAIPSEEIKISVPSGAKYTATGIWYDETGAWAAGTFQKGKAYTLAVNIDPKDGYEFAGTLIIIADGVKHKYTHNSPEGAYFSKTTSFRKEIKKVQLTGLTEPKAGATPDTQISLPADAPYTVKEITWTGGIGEWADDEVSGAFESGKAYRARIVLSAKEGYEFNENTVVTLNGKEVRINMQGTGMIEIIENWSLEKVITNIKVNNVPTMKIGQKARSNVTIPKGAKYDIRWAGWSVWSDDISSWEPFEGTFEKGKVYEFSFTAVPAEGYRFSDEDTKVYINGRENSNVLVATYFATYREDYSAAMKVIDKVQFHVTEPKVGEHNSMNAVITTADGAKYSVNYSHWLRRTDGGIIYAMDEGLLGNGGYFQEGVDYGIELAFSADAGYVFSDELIVIVNGRLLEAGDFMHNSKNGSITVFFSDLLNRKAVDEENDKGSDDVVAPEKEDSETADTGASDTGDEADMLPWVILASVSLMAAVGVMSRRKVS